jgi:ubiquinone/menaquinone biosynthesis C-methylase UbiE
MAEEKSLARVVERPKPTLVTVGKRQVISSGRWNDGIMADYVLLHGRAKWLPIRDLARVAYCNGTPRSQERVRACLHKLFRTVLSRGELLVIEYGPPHNSAKALKIFDKNSELERQTLQSKLERMRQRRELSSEQYEHAMLLWQGREDGQRHE